MPEVCDLEVIKLHCRQAIEEKATHFLICRRYPKTNMDVIYRALVPEEAELYYVWPGTDQTIEQCKNALTIEGYEILGTYEVPATMDEDELFDLVIN